MTRAAPEPDWRAALGTLVVVPTVVLLWGSSWEAPFPIDQRWLLPSIWGSWLLLSALAGGAGRLGGSAGRALEVWRRMDPLLAALLVQSVLFRFPETVGIPGLILGVLCGAFAALRRASAPVLVSLGVAFLVFAVAVPRAFRALMIARAAQTYALDVDHRLWPDGKEINSDGVRLRGEAEDLADEDFVILFVGDSFTFGWNLPYEDAYPYQFEAMAGRAGCDPTVRAVTMGWTSSSPLLGLRLLRQVAYKYRPDLVVYNLDVTDFHDDLRYERSLREQSDFEFDAPAMAERLLLMYWPWARDAVPWLRAVTDRLRGVDRAGRERLLAGLEVPGRLERFFVTARPLDESRPAMELGAMKNLAEMNAFAAEVLSAPMALVIYPRAYQYSDRESPANWEPGYEALGPHVREPFRYFAEVGDRLPYPVIDLFSAFETSKEFPLFFARDPHWNARGAGLAARSVYAGLSERGLLPCPGGEEP